MFALGCLMATVVSLALGMGVFFYPLACVTFVISGIALILAHKYNKWKDNDELQ